MAENISGIVYHCALNLFFTGIKEKNELLLKPLLSDNGPSLPKEYCKLLELSVNAIFDAFPALQTAERPQMSSLTARLLRAGKKHFQFNLEKCLANFLLFFAGCRIIGCETSYQSERDFYFLNGKLDCILKTPENKYIIVDFKTNWMPSRAVCIGGEENGLSDFQLPVYINLAEENEKIKIFTVLFYSILKLKPEIIVGTVQDVYTEVIIPKKEEDRIMRESERFCRIIKEVNQKAGQFAKEISTGNFTVFETRYNECNNCQFNRICRTVYVINRERKLQ